LEAQIAEWRSYFRRRQAIREVDVAELEDPLRGQVESLMGVGLGEDDVFLVALKRMGAVDALSQVAFDLRRNSKLGTPGILVVTNGHHRIDVHSFREKLGVSVLAPGPSRGRVAERAQVDGDLSALPADPALRADPLPA
jgi:hypothetical protein